MSNPIPEDLRRRIEAHGASVAEAHEIDYATQYRLVRGPEEAILNVYRTGAVSEGGKESGLKALLRDWRLSREGSATSGARTATRPVPNATPRIGTDEAGKGEYLGPLVVAGTRVLGAQRDLELRESGIRDSKALGLRQVRAMASRASRILGPENVRVISLSPREYEARRAAARGNVNRLLGELNAEIINELLNDEVEAVVVDAFGEKARFYMEPGVPQGVRLEVRPRAEDDAAVAAASILARARYLKEMDELSERVGFALPRGSTHVLDAGRRVFGERGKGGLEEVAKTSFRITEQIVGDEQ